MAYKDPERQRKYQREYVSSRRKAWLAGKSCAICKSTNQLEIHHVNHKAKVSHRIWSWSEDRRLVELAKCIVLCSAHHKLETRKQRIKHGISRYAAGCRCGVCKDAKSQEKRRYLNRKHQLA